MRHALSHVVVGLFALSTIGTRVDAEPVASVTIHDCASFRAWLRQQPVAAIGDPASPDNSLAGAPEPGGGSDEFLVPVATTTYFRGLVGGGGCLGGRYDATARVAVIAGYGDTEREGIATIVTSVPKGLRSGTSRVQTRNGARLGMTVAEIEHIEGRGFHRLVRGGELLEYRWHSRTYDGSSIIYNSLTFVARGGRVVAMEYDVGP
jgi:hypothetical protein